MRTKPTFQQLLGNLDLEVFFEQYWGKQYLFIPAQDRERNLPINESDLNYFLSNSRLQYPYLKLVYKGEAVSFELFKNTDLGPYSSIVDLQKVFKLMYQGHTLAINSLDRMLPKLTEFNQKLSRELNTTFWVNAYLTPSNQQGLNKHSDAHDVFVIQLKGIKEWTIYPTEEEKKIIKLEEGDFLYLPKGTAHHATTTDKASIHLTFGAHFHTHADLLKELWKKASESERFSKRLTLDTNQLSASDTIFFKEAMNELLDSQTINESYQDLNSEAIPAFSSTNLLDQWLKIDGLKANTLLRKTTQSAQLIDKSKKVELHFNGNYVSFPIFIKDFIQKLIDTEIFSASDLSSSSSLNEKVRVLKKLLQLEFLCFA
jgi:ribosomal protein L16 Arg81 hydroxylase